MKDLKLIETLVVSYFHENKKIDEYRLEEFLKESINIEIGSVTYEDDILTIIYGPKNKSKKLIFEVHNDKIKHKKDETI